MISQIELMRLSALTNAEFARSLVPSGKMTVKEIPALARMSEDIRRAADEFSRNNQTAIAVKEDIIRLLANLERWARTSFVAYRTPLIIRQHPLLTRYGAKMQANLEFYKFWRAEEYTTGT